MPLPRIHHHLSSFFCFFLVFLSSEFLISQAFQTVFHNVIPLFSFLQVIIIVEHKEAIVVDTPSTTEWRKRNCRLNSLVCISLHNFRMIRQFSCLPIHKFSLPVWTLTPKKWLVLVLGGPRILSPGIILGHSCIGFGRWNLSSVDPSVASVGTNNIGRTGLYGIHSRFVDFADKLTIFPAPPVWRLILFKCVVLNVQITQIQNRAWIINILINLVINLRIPLLLHLLLPAATRPQPNRPTTHLTQPQLLEPPNPSKPSASHIGRLNLRIHLVTLLPAPALTTLLAASEADTSRCHWRTPLLHSSELFGGGHRRELGSWFWGGDAVPGLLVDQLTATVTLIHFIRKK